MCSMKQRAYEHNAWNGREGYYLLCSFLLEHLQKHLYGSAWFGSVWGGILGGICARGIFPPRECFPGPSTRNPFNY